MKTILNTIIVKVTRLILLDDYYNDRLIIMIKMNNNTNNKGVKLIKQRFDRQRQL